MKRFLRGFLISLGIVAGISIAAVTTVPAITGVGLDLTNAITTGVLGAANGGTGVANNAAATLTRSGNHALTITTTNTTGVTLPTSGTLATVGGNIGAATGTTLDTTGKISAGISNMYGAANNVANNATLALPATGRWSGFVVVTSINMSGATARTTTTYHVAFYDGDNSIITQIATSTGSGGASAFSVSAVAGAFTVTNTAGTDRSIYISAFGQVTT